ncbi:hypothetical protein [Deinococcus frigens]|uniref:hypothetical protein n=1 Tax=Deinococcus frigens TaxID=249403 RepID=UPI0012ECA5B6|nr:hypothetical protein [Deinococcus frigens]
MTTFQKGASPAHVPASSAVEPADKTKAAELYAQVKGTEREADFLRVSKAHSQKNGSSAMYRAFLRDIEALFVVQPAQVPPAAPASHPHALTAAVFSGVAPDSSLDDGELDRLDGPDNWDGTEPGPDGGNEVTEPGPGHVNGRRRVQADAGASVIQDVEDDGGAVDLPAPAPIPGGLISQLAAMIGEGGVVTLTVMKIGENVTLGFAPRPTGTETAVPVIVTAKAAHFDEHLLRDMQPYVAARQSAAQVFAAAARQQIKAVAKAQDKPAAPDQAKASAPGKARTHAVTLLAVDGTALTATMGGKSIDVRIGENQLPPGTLCVDARHPLFGEHKKTLLISMAKTHDFRDQQGARLTVNTTPDAAAVTAVKGETRLSLHGETLLPGGKWEITAEAAEHDSARQAVTLSPGKPQVINLTLSASNSLF